MVQEYRLDHVACYGARNINRCDMSRSLERLGVVAFAFLCLCAEETHGSDGLMTHRRGETM